MSSVTKTIIVATTPAKAWALISDVSTVQKWHPKVDTSPVLSESSVGIGATRRCNFYDGTSVVEEVVDQEPGKFLKVELSEFSMPLSSASAELGLRSLSSDRTEVSISMEYETKFGPIGWVMDAVMMKSMMGKVFEQVLDGLKHHLETDELIPQDWTPGQPTAGQAQLSVAS
jgi:ribosome-associated toxin RatA of RatAB toxin-antitoxin module